MSSLFQVVNMKPFNATIRLERGKIELKRKEIVICYAYFTLDKYQLTICDINTTRRYQRKGYGSIMMHILMSVAKSKKVPIYLYSLSDVVKFYEKLGFIRLRRYRKGWYRGKRVVIDNLNVRKTFGEQTNKTDMVWIPSNVHIVHLCIQSTVMFISLYSYTYNRG